MSSNLGHDSRWAARFELLAEYKAEYGNASPPPGHQMDGVNIGSWIRSQRVLHGKGQLSLERTARLESLGVVWQVRTAQWDRNFALLRQYKREHGTTYMSKNVAIDGVRLGSWLAAQVEQRNAGTLTADRHKRLESLGMEWEAGYSAKTWDRAFSNLEAQIVSGGSGDLSSIRASDSVGVGGWLATQRHKFRTGTLMPSRALRLESLGLSLNLREDTWNARVESLAACERSTVNAPADPGLRQWLFSRRAEYNRGNLSPERVRKLESLGVVWSASAARWDRNLALLEDFVAEQGNSSVPKHHVQEGIRLGSWVRVQRAKLGAGTLSAERSQRLTALGVLTPADSDSPWSKALSLLISYKIEHGDVRVPRRHKESGFGLGLWLGVQRRAAGTGKLSAERMAALDGLGNWGPEITWEEAFDLLVAYADKNGHANVPGDYRVAGVALGTWVRTQRREYRLERMLPERQTKLDDAGFQWRMRVPSQVR